MAAMIVEDYGTVIRLTLVDATGAVVDISSATTKEILLTKPDGSTLTKTASFTSGGTDGRLQYTTVDGDIDQSGKWYARAHLIGPTYERRSEQVEIVVAR